MSVGILPHLLDVVDGQADDQVHQDDDHLHHEDREEEQHDDPVLEGMRNSFLHKREESKCAFRGLFFRFFPLFLGTLLVYN